MGAGVAVVSKRGDRRALERNEGDLRFLAVELSGLPWPREGLRVAAEAQFEAGDLRYAAETNLRLGTINQKLGDLVRSDEALKKVIAAKGLDSQDLAEAQARAMSSSRRFAKT